MALCQQLARGGWPWQVAEIVSVDSAQVYRGMDIGTAKPDAAARAAVPHHLLDLLDPAETYSAARFADDAGTAISAIRARGHLPVLVGGTLLYYRALLDGLSVLPSADPDLRRAIEAEAAAIGWEAMHARLTQIDPATAARLHPNDAQRVGRALEVFRLSGEPLSRHHAQPLRPLIAGPILRLAVTPPDRLQLGTRIEQRLRQMMADGFIDEVATLRERNDLHPALPSMRAVGYRQIWACLDGEYDRDEALRRCIYATRQYAKRQLTWLRGDPRWQVVDAMEPLELERVLNDMCAMQQV
jgi:tRNA dimethylallyltransferase